MYLNLRQIKSILKTQNPNKEPGWKEKPGLPTEPQRIQWTHLLVFFIEPVEAQIPKNPVIFDLSFPGSILCHIL